MLGIGSYGPQTACFKAFKLVDDINIPGTLNTAALTITIAGTLLFINTIEMEIMTLIWMVIASSLGAAIGSRFVTKLDVTKIRYAMGGALAVVALIFAAGQLNLLPSTGGELLGLHGWKLIVACVIVFHFRRVDDDWDRMLCSHYGDNLSFGNESGDCLSCHVRYLCIFDSYWWVQVYQKKDVMTEDLG